MSVATSTADSMQGGPTVVKPPCLRVLHDDFHLATLSRDGG